MWKMLKSASFWNSEEAFSIASLLNQHVMAYIIHFNYSTLSFNTMQWKNSASVHPYFTYKLFCFEHYVFSQMVKIFDQKKTCLGSAATYL